MNSPHREQVNHPDHYNQGDIECIDALESALGSAGYEGFCIGNALKYLWRAPHKGVREQDLRKARWYLDRLLPAHHGDVSTGSVDRNVTGADVIDWADGIRGALGTEHASKVTAQEARIADAIVSAMHAPDQDAADTDSEPTKPLGLDGRWHYSHGILYCGRIGISKVAPDTQPSMELIDELGEWLAWALNSMAERTEESTAATVNREQALIALGKYHVGYRPGTEGWTPEDQAALDEANIFAGTGFEPVSLREMALQGIEAWQSLYENEKGRAQILCELLDECRRELATLAADTRRSVEVPGDGTIPDDHDFARVTKLEDLVTRCENVRSACRTAAVSDNDALRQLAKYDEAEHIRRAGGAVSMAVGLDWIAQEIMEERNRQTSHEGWTPEHDDLHNHGELAMAAACYAAPETILVHRYELGPSGNTGDRGDRGIRPAGYFDPWPFPDYDKRDKHDRRRQLVIAGALIQAEIERLDRVEAREASNVE